MPALPPLARPRGLRRPGHTRAARLVARAPPRARAARFVSEQDFRGCRRWLRLGLIGKRLGRVSLNGCRPRLRFRCGVGCLRLRSCDLGLGWREHRRGRPGSGSGPRAASSGAGPRSGSLERPRRRPPRAAPRVSARGLVGLGGPGRLIGLRAPGPRLRRPGQTDGCPAPAGSGSGFVGRGGPGLLRGAGSHGRLRRPGRTRTAPRQRAPARAHASSAGADQDCSAGAASSAGSGSETVSAGSDWANVVAASTVAAAQRSEPRAS